MAAPISRSFGSNDILATFKANLQTWRRAVADDRHFYDVAAFQEWMERKEPEEQFNNTKLLLLALEPKMMRHRRFPFEAHKITDDSKRCLLVFGVLLEQDCGEFIDLFHNAGIVDLGLEDSQHKHHILKQEFSGVVGDEVTQKFENAKWRFYPATISLNMESRFEGGGWILPFCRRTEVNGKGGTASVDRVSVQKAFIPPELQKVLWKSAYVDREYGECYWMALKVFARTRWDDFHDEREALSILRDKSAEAKQDESQDSNNVVQYLGSFSYDCETDGKTYNLLLEYGEQDLDEYFADHAPPVACEEIYSFWEGLFKIANALLSVHSFSYEAGRDYDGWHGDVKPDNILVVHSELKLADFGFARFQVRGKEVPKEHIKGGTETYGAPEVGSTRGGNKVMQTIDTWSFGTVLSIAATWVVLGNKGILEFETVRKFAISKLKKDRAQGNTPSADDAFHDGKSVLRDIRLWHDHLKAHMRVCDTITKHVLDLVDSKMLLEHPSDRLTCAQLCNHLQKILEDAKDDRKKMIHDSEIKETHATILQAQLAVEEASRRGTAPGENVDDKQIRVNATVDVEAPDQTYGKTFLRIPVHRSVRNSRRVGKSAKLEKIPLGKTSHRASLLQSELKDHGFSAPTVLEEQAGLSDQLLQSDTTTTHGESHRAPTSPEPSLMGKGKSPAQTEIPRFEARSMEDPLGVHGIWPQPSHIGTSREFEAPQNYSARTPSRADPTISVTSYRGSPHLASNPFHPGSPSGFTGDPFYKNTLGKHDLEGFVPFPESSHSVVPGATEFGYSPPSTQTSLPRTGPLVTALPTVMESSPEPSTARTHANVESGNAREMFPSTEDPVILVPTQSSPPPVENGTSLTDHSGQTDNGRAPANTTVGSSHRPSRTSTGFSSIIPRSIVELQSRYDIFKVRQEEEEKLKKEKGIIGKLKSAFGVQHDPDEYLKNFIVDRDMVIVLDNGTSMRKSQHTARLIVETLAMKLAGLDEDGLDLIFTIGEKNNLYKVKDTAPAMFGNAVSKAWPSEEYCYKTDMSISLSRLFTKYNRSKKMTILVVTDGMWDGPTPENEIDKTETALVEFMDYLNQVYIPERRRFTIQFIQIDGDEKATDRLKRFDDDLHNIYPNFKDFIDFVPWTGSVGKMILGSVTDAFDKEETEKTEVPPNIEALCRQFYLEQPKRSLTDKLSSPSRRAQSSSHLKRPSTDVSGTRPNSLAPRWT